MATDLQRVQNLARITRRLLYDLLRRDLEPDPLTYENASYTLAWCANAISQLPELSAESAGAWLATLPGVQQVLLFLGEYLAPPPLPSTPPSSSGR